MFNADGYTLDDMTVDDIRDTAGIPVTVVSCSVPEYLKEIEELVAGYAALPSFSSCSKKR